MSTSSSTSSSNFRFIINSTTAETIITNILNALNTREHQQTTIPVKNNTLNEAYKTLGISDIAQFVVNKMGVVVYSRPQMYKTPSGDFNLRVNGKDYPADDLHPTGFNSTTGLVEFNNSGLMVKVQGIKANPNVNPQSWVARFTTDSWTELVEGLPPQALDLDCGFYQVTKVENGNIQVKGSDKWFVGKDACKQPNNLIVGDWVAQVYTPFLNPQGERVDWWRSYKFGSARTVKFDINTVEKLSGFVTKIAATSVSTFLQTMLHKQHPEFGKHPLPNQVINFPQGDDYVFEWVGLNSGLRFNGTTEEVGDIVLLRYKNQLIAVGATTSLTQAASLHDVISAVRVTSAKDFNGKWFVTFQPILNQREAWAGGYEFDDTGLPMVAGATPLKNLAPALDIQEVVSDNVDINEFQVISQEEVDEIPF